MAGPNSNSRWMRDIKTFEIRLRTDNAAWPWG
jgi:hypothetical protein